MAKVQVEKIMVDKAANITNFCFIIHISICVFLVSYLNSNADVEKGPTYLILISLILILCIYLQLYYLCALLNNACKILILNGLFLNVNVIVFNNCSGGKDGLMYKNLYNARLFIFRSTWAKLFSQLTQRDWAHEIIFWLFLSVSSSQTACEFG